MRAPAAAREGLVLGGWSWGETPSVGLLAAPSGTAFTTIVLGRLANAFTGRTSAVLAAAGPSAGTALGWAIGLELGMLGMSLVVPPVPVALGNVVPTAIGFGVAALPPSRRCCSPTPRTRWCGGTALP